MLFEAKKRRIESGKSHVKVLSGQLFDTLRKLQIDFILGVLQEKRD